MSNSEETFTKTPRQIDAELEVAFSERKSLQRSIIVLLILLMVLLGILVVLVRANMAIFPRHKVVYTTNAEAVCAFTPVAERGNVTGAVVENFAANVVRELHLLDYVNYRSTLARVMDRHFTPEAREATTRAMLTSGILRTVVQQGFVIRALPNDRPTLLREGIGVREVGGMPEPTYTWVLRVPIKVAYAYRGADNAPNYRPEDRDVYMTVIRTSPSAANPTGLLVSKLVSLQASESFDISTMMPGGSLAPPTN